ncbi:nucleoporin NSP1-like [Setaria italica]|uniref:nucleoporin NSP1-like n=1 Tax=Setaria italica TaxID=4555 RepID=UPI000649022D|nr:nucleoporin NSP1-like [Setaria italica]
MGSWAISHFNPSRTEGLVRKGLLCERTEAGGWELLEMEQALAPPTDYHITAFIALCEGFLGIEPNFSLWKYFFTGSMAQVVDSRSPVPEDAERRLAAPRGLVLQLAPKKALRVSSARAERNTAPPAASDGVPGEVVGPTAEVAPVMASGGVVLPPGAGEGADPAPPSTSLADPVVQSIAPRGPQAGEVIDLNADEAGGMAAVVMATDVPAAATGTTAATEGGEPAPAATAGTVATGEARTEEAVATETGTSTQGAMAEVAPAAEAEVPAPEAPTGVEALASAVAMEGEVATGMLAPPPASEAVAPTGGPAATSTGAGARVPGPSVNPTASGMVEPILMAASGSAPTSTSATPILKAWRGSILRWSSRDDPSRQLFTLDDAAEWRKWQAMQGGLANARAALSLALGELDSVVLPGSQAL